MTGELLSRDMQIQWAGLLLGDGTDYSVETLQGWDDLPSLDSGTVLRAQQHGAVPGLLLAKSRVLVLDLTLTCELADFPAVRRALLTATALAQDEQPLVVQLAGEQQMVNARIIARAIPTGQQFAQGAPHVTLTWEATDARRYDVDEQVATTALPTSETGLAWGSPETGLAWGSPETGLAWGTPGSTGDVLCTADGDTDTGMVIEIHGPCITPSITLFGTTTVLEYALTLTATDVLTIDTAAGTVLLGGQDRANTATARSVPEELLRLPPGDTVVSFRSADAAPTAATATVRWRSAYW